MKVCTLPAVGSPCIGIVSHDAVVDAATVGLERRRTMVASIACRAVVLLWSSAAGAQVTPRTVWTAEARSSMPAWVQVWIPFMFLVFGTGLLFVRRHPEAWWMVGAFVASHLASGIERAVLGADRFTVGMIAINHCLFWTPAVACFYLTTRRIRAPKSFRIWRNVVLATAAISLVFDYRDAWIFLRPLVEPGGG